MKLSQFDYDLPPELIAQFPPTHRTDSRMMVINRADQTLEDRNFRDLPQIIDDSYFLVLNDSRVFKARLIGHRKSGGKVEIFMVRKIDGNNWLALLRPSGRIKKNEQIYFTDDLSLTVSDEPGKTERQISFVSDKAEQEIINNHGQVPLPPYIKRTADSNDLDRYQTVYANDSGSVAAPTAGLHFDDVILKTLSDKNIASEKITLHVGPGTFKPVISEEIEDHYVDPELARISDATARSINDRKKTGSKLLAVGTTAVRTLETSADSTGQLTALDDLIDLYIRPPYQYKVVDALLTNFHLPKSSLLMLVAALCGRKFLFEAYHHAVSEKYRFYSYGDCMLIL